MAEVEGPPEAELYLEDVYKSFGELHVLKGVSFSFPAGKTTAIIGPSGTGKSVLLKHLVGLLRPDRGKVMVFGTDMAAAGEREMFAVRKRMGMLFQDGALFDSMTVGENIEFPLVHHAKEMSAARRRERVEEVLEQVELPGLADRPTSALSGGQRKRVGLARAIVTRPEVILFDEPNSGLDPITSDAIDALIGSMKERLGITFIVISHDIVGTVNVADYIGMLYGGHLVEYGPTEDVLRSENEIVRRFLHRNLELPAGPGEPPRLPSADRWRR
jgi:phospholipid/cholesterol/gamma-HCH transport system ATP-binding protein